MQARLSKCTNLVESDLVGCLPLLLQTQQQCTVTDYLLTHLESAQDLQVPIVSDSLDLPARKLSLPGLHIHKIVPPFCKHRLGGDRERPRRFLEEKGDRREHLWL